MKYLNVKPGEWLPVKKRGEKVMCCDCSLVHVHDYKIIDGVIYERSRRDERATAAARRKKRDDFT